MNKIPTGETDYDPMPVGQRYSNNDLLNKVAVLATVFDYVSTIHVLSVCTEQIIASIIPYLRVHSIAAKCRDRKNWLGAATLLMSRVMIRAVASNWLEMLLSIGLQHYYHCHMFRYCSPRLWHANYRPCCHLGSLMLKAQREDNMS